MLKKYVEINFLETKLALEICINKILKIGRNFAFAYFWCQFHKSVTNIKLFTQIWSFVFWPYCSLNFRISIKYGRVANGLWNLYWLSHRLGPCSTELHSVRLHGSWELWLQGLQYHIKCVLKIHKLIKIISLCVCVWCSGGNQANSQTSADLLSRPSLGWLCFHFVSTTSASATAAMTLLLTSKSFELNVRYLEHGWVSKLISSIPLFPTVTSMMKTLVTYGISRSYSPGVTTAQLWWHLANMNVIMRI